MSSIPVSAATSAGLAAPVALPAALLPLAAAENVVQLAAPAANLAASSPLNSPANSLDNEAATRHYLEARRAALQTEKRELAHLQHRADSLLHLLALGAEGTLQMPAPATISPELAAEMAAAAANQPIIVRRAPALTHRWLVHLTAAPERAFLAEPNGTPTDSLTALRARHETGRAGLSAALQAEYRLTDRLSVSAGAGYARLGTEIRLTETRTTVAVQYTTVTTVTGGQTTIVTTPTVAPQTTETYRVLRPTYHFLTVPVLVRYRLTPTSRSTRCWADAAVGAQALLFRGGTEVLANAARLSEQSVGANGSALRPFTVALTGALAVNFAVSPRLTARVAPAVRWQTQSLYRRSPGLPQRPTSAGLQLGLSWVL